MTRNRRHVDQQVRMSMGRYKDEGAPSKCDCLDSLVAGLDVVFEFDEELKSTFGPSDDAFDLLALGRRLVQRGAEPLAQVPSSEAKNLAHFSGDPIGMGGRECDGLRGRIGRCRREGESELATDVTRNGARQVDDDIDDESDGWWK